MKISYAITVCNELEEIKHLVSFLLLHKREEDEVIILDYKFTLEESDKHIEQITTYKNLLQAMDYTNVKTYLFYAVSGKLKLVWLIFCSSINSFLFIILELRLSLIGETSSLLDYVDL
jgi:hypothetical protein